MRTSWEMLRHILNICMQQPAGKYVLMRDAQKQMIHLYAMDQEENSKDEE